MGQYRSVAEIYTRVTGYGENTYEEHCTDFLQYGHTAAL